MYGEVISVQNTGGIDRLVIDLRCIMRSPENMSFPLVAGFSISETPSPCTNSIVNVATGDVVIVALKEDETGVADFTFDEVNGQSGLFMANDATLAAVMGICGFQSPSGDDCPAAVPENDCTTSGVVSFLTSYSPLMMATLLASLLSCI